VSTRRRFLAGAGVMTLALAGGGGFILNRDDSNGGDAAGADTADSDTPTTSTATVTRKDLQERQELDGTLGFGEESDVSLAAQGIITALPALGTIVDRGQTIVEVDSLPIPLLFGDRPFWRSMDANSEDGVDIQELESNLVELGFATSDALTVDNKWTAATTTAVKKWQKSLGRDETGVVTPGDAVVLPGAVRISGHPTEVGGGAGGPVVQVTGTAREVTIDLEATKQSLISIGQPVEIELPDGTITTGTVSEVGTVAEADENSDPQQPSTPTIEVTVSLSDPAAAGNLDHAPVTVRVVTSAATGVLAVPVDALLALSEGGFAVELVGSGRTTNLVSVETGAFADGWVEITGDIEEGDEVVVPA
jgi:hypothetical protein